MIYNIQIEGVASAVVDSFISGFRDRTGSARRTCNCGREFFDNVNSWDFYEGELEALHENSNATALAYAVESIELEGRYFVTDCNCWHQRAARVIQFLIAHDEAIAVFLSAEKARKTVEADRSPVVV
jgi:hypothetical protein